MSDRPDIVEAVLGAATPARRARLPVALGAVLAAYIGLIVGLQRAAVVPAAMPSRMAREFEIEVATSPPHPVRSERELAMTKRGPLPPPAHDAHASRPRLAEPAAAQAAPIIAQQPVPDAPVDLTGDTVVTGTAKAYTGGVTPPSGTAASAVTRGHLADQGPAGPPAAADRSRLVSLESGNWSCPWPREADRQQIDEQTVVLRAVVRSDGSVESVAVVADPGHGFGSAAAACAKQTRFTPARDRKGDPIRSMSPPIRVRFTR